MTDEEKLDEILKPLQQLRGLTTEDSTELARQDLNAAKQALLEMIREAKIEAHRRGYEYGAKWDNAMFRRANIADPKKPVNLDEVLRLAIERYSDEDEAHTTRRA